MNSPVPDPSEEPTKDDLGAREPEGGGRSASRPGPGEPAPKAAAEQDFLAAVHEIESNLETRRLMLVISHILVPALCMAVTDSLAGSEYPAPLEWLPRHVLALVGATLVVAGVLITLVLGRCHFGLVLNGTKIDQVLRGDARARGLNWLGVTTNFTLVTALSAGGGAGLLLLEFVEPWIALLGALGLPPLLMSVLAIQHRRANRLAATLRERWNHGPISHELREKHVQLSLDATSADVAIVVTMAAALFAGSFNCLTNLAGVSSGEFLPVPRADWIHAGTVALSAYTSLSLLLSGRMVIRLRIALASFAAQLATLREEPDTPYRFNPLEKTFLLYLLILGFTTLAVSTLAWTSGGAVAGTAIPAIVCGLALSWYPLQLRLARPKD